MCAVGDVPSSIGCALACIVFFQAEDGIRDLVRSRGLGDVYKRQMWEVIRIANKLGIQLGKQDLANWRVVLAGMNPDLSLIHI